MSPSTEMRLKQAEELFYSWRMVESYNLFRRYFDRIPFKPEKDHAKYIGVFVRVLLELGKDFELDFYVSELEKHYERYSLPEITYQLGMTYLAKNKMERARGMFEEILRNEKAAEFHTRAKMALMFYYGRLKPRDVASCRLLLDSIKEPEDQKTKVLVEIWQANVLRYEKKFDQAESLLTRLCEQVSFEKNWYEYFYVHSVLAWLFLDRHDFKKVSSITSKLHVLFENKRSKTVQARLSELEKAAADYQKFHDIEFSTTENRRGYVMKYSDKTLEFSPKSSVEKLLLLFMRKRFLGKDRIVSVLYDRNYDPKKDDRIIYAQIHALRKKLKTLGLPSNVISSEQNGYRLLPAVKKVRMQS